MTETTPQYYAPAPGGTVPVPPPAPPVQLNPAGTTDLGRLLEQLAVAKAAVTEAEARRDAIIADIKAQGVRFATALNGGTAPEHIRFAAAATRPPWNLDWVTERRFSTEKFKADQPALYEAYRVPKGRWVLGPGG